MLHVLHVTLHVLQTFHVNYRDDIREDITRTAIPTNNCLFCL